MTYDFSQKLILVKLSENEVRSLQSRVLTKEVSENLKCSYLTNINLPPFFSVPVIELSEEQKQHILNSREFSRFFDKATRLMERALCETVDITFDYSGAEAEDTEG